MDPSKFTSKATFTGIWFLIHLQAAHATTDELKKAFVKNMQILAENFKCLECQDHFKTYLKKHPFKPYWNRTIKGRDAGFFEWTVQFHNSVNERLGKPILTFDETYPYYTNAEDGVCQDCLADDLIEPPTSLASSVVTSFSPYKSGYGSDVQDKDVSRGGKKDYPGTGVIISPLSNHPLMTIRRTTKLPPIRLIGKK